MMKPEEVADKFHDDRGGFDLVDFMEVGLPFYHINATALMQVRKKHSPIEEFTMRAISEGLNTPSKISSFLGLSIDIVVGTLSNLIRSNDIYEAKEQLVVLSKKGEKTLVDDCVIKPADQSIEFTYDGLLRKTIWISNQDLFTPRQAETGGLKQIRPFPARKPREDELNVIEILDSLKKSAGRRKETRQLLKIKEVRVAHRVFISAVMLIYRGKDSNEIQVGFAIDGRLSFAHELAFAEAGGPKVLGITDSVLSNTYGYTSILESDNSSEEKIKKEISRAKEKANKIKKKVIGARFKAQVAEKKVISADDHAKRDKAQHDLEKAQTDISDSEGALLELSIRDLSVYEHPKLLNEAINNAKDHLLIISVGRQLLCPVGDN